MGGTITIYDAETGEFLGEIWQEDGYAGFIAEPPERFEGDYKTNFLGETVHDVLDRLDWHERKFGVKGSFWDTGPDHDCHCYGCSLKRRGHLVKMRGALEPKLMSPQYLREFPSTNPHRKPEKLN